MVRMSISVPSSTTSYLLPCATVRLDTASSQRYFLRMIRVVVCYQDECAPSTDPKRGEYNPDAATLSRLDWHTSAPVIISLEVLPVPFARINPSDLNRLCGLICKSDSQLLAHSLDLLNAEV